uniref:Uncharacterized protein n=1 Tax=Rhizophora mucronata TaxID=61149 RepID=A0A2P2PX24_RHIMU
MCGKHLSGAGSQGFRVERVFITRLKLNKLAHPNKN